MRNEFRAWVLRATLTGFTAGCRLLLPEVPHFGDLVKVRLHPGLELFGLIYEVRVDDDPAVRQLILADVLEREAILDQRENRLVPIELSILTLGYSREGRIIHGLPPQPPVNLDFLIRCDQSELRTFSASLSYLALIVNASHLPADELVIVHLRAAAEARPPEVRYRFLVEAGRQLARLLAANLTRLEAILTRIRPEQS